MTGDGVLYIVGCAAPPVLELPEACRVARDYGWQPYVILTPTAADWVDLDAIAAVAAAPPRFKQRRPDEPDPFPPADALLVAPATFNTINKWAAGINDTAALGVLNELLVEDLSVLVVPNVKPSLRRHPAYAASTCVLASSHAIFCNQFLLGRRSYDRTQPWWKPLFDERGAQ